MTLYSYTEQLESVQEAIATIETRGQTADVNGRRLGRADLQTLYAREKRLLRLVALEKKGGIPVKQVVPQ